MATSIEQLVGARRVHVAHLADTEVLYARRRWARRGELDRARVEAALEDHRDLPLVRWAHAPLGRRVWALRDALSACDATYVALAESLEATLVTADERLGRTASRLVRAGG